MGCCGETVKMVRNIAVGYTRLATDTIGISKKPAFTDSRIRKCRMCDESTWLTMKEYAKWLRDNGIKILENFNQLEALPKLLKYELDDKRRNIFCRICKCYIPVAARAPDKKCPHPQGDKWEMSERKMVN